MVSHSWSSLISRTLVSDSGWWMGMSPAFFFSFKNFLLNYYRPIPSLPVMICLWLSIQMLPFFVEVVLPNCQNKVYRQLFSSCDQSPRRPPLSLVSPTQRRRRVSRVPLQSLLTISPSLKRKSQNSSFPSTVLCVHLSWNTTCFPALLILLGIFIPSILLTYWLFW